MFYVGNRFAYITLALSVVAVASIIFFIFGFMRLVDTQGSTMDGFYQQELLKAEQLAVFQRRITQNHGRLVELLLSANDKANEVIIYERGVVVVDDLVDIRRDMTGGWFVSLSDVEEVLYDSLAEKIDQYIDLTKWSIEMASVDLSQAGEALDQTNVVFIELVDLFLSLEKSSLVRSQSVFAEVSSGLTDNLSAAMWTAIFVISIIIILLANVYLLGRSRLLFVNRQNAMLEESVSLRTKELSLANALLQQSNNVKTEFLTRMSHELRTPLNAIIGNSQLLAMDEISKEQHDGLSDIQLAGKQLLSMIDDMLTFNSVNKSLMDIELTTVDLIPEITRVLAELHDIAIAKHVTITNRSPARCVVYGENEFLPLVIHQLLSNAIKYNKEGGSVTVECLHIDDMVELRVCDTGVGIESDDCLKIFEPFYKKDTNSEVVHGTGIGLSLCKSLVEQMNGVIKVSSEPGKGSCFAVLLRAAP